MGGGLGSASRCSRTRSACCRTRRRATWLAAALAPPALFYLLVTVILVGRGQIHSFNALEFAVRAVLVPASIAAGVLGAGATGFVAVSIIVWLSAGVMAVVLVGRYTRISLRPSFELLVIGFRYATKAYLITLLAFVALRGNIFLLRRSSAPPTSASTRLRCKSQTCSFCCRRPSR